MSLLFVPVACLFYCLSLEVAIVASCISAIFMGIACASDRVGTALKKWGISILFTILLCLWLGPGDFLIRMVNVVDPGYGRLSAGSGFGLIFLAAAAVVSHGLALVMALTSSIPQYESDIGEPSKARLFIQDYILPVVCGVILIAVIYFEITAPDWRSYYMG